ncbi:hypothetical protein [Actinophytocola sp.]|uniref:hypothetical protein n=1 Tax=Actinophytocola sp. TaxID=1872138 RepID=UPI003D6C335C
MRPIQDGGGRAEIPRPRAVDVAFRASLASTAIASVATVVTVLLDRAWLERFARQMLAESGRPEADLSTGIAIAQVSLGIGILLFAGVFVLFALKMRAGRGWARVVLTLFAVLGAVNFLTAVANTGAELGLMWSLAEVAFSVTAVIYMFRPESTTYFAEHRKRRLARRGGQPRP